MEGETPDYFEGVLEHCRSRLAAARESTTELSKLELTPPARIRRDAKVLYAQQRVVLEHGNVHWGWNALSHDATWRAGTRPLPGSFTHSTLDSYDGHPEQLYEIGRRLVLSAHRMTIPPAARVGCKPGLFTPETHPELVPVLEKIAATNRLDHGVPVPGHRSIYFTRTMIHRAYLPHNRLTSDLFPVVFAPGHSKVALILPCSLWPKRFIKRGWRE